MSATPHPLQQTLLRPASPGASSTNSESTARKIAADAVEAPKCPIAWGAWLRKYQLGSWCEKAESQSTIDPKQPVPDAVVADDASTAEPVVPSASPVNGVASANTRATPAKPAKACKPYKAHRTVKLDSEAVMDSMDFYQEHGWLAAPPLPRRQYRKVAEALRRHGLTAAQEREALLLYIRHAKAVFRCEYSSFMVESSDDAYMLILAQDGGDAEVQIVPRNVTLCSHAMLLPDDEVLVVSNTKKDWRFRSCPSTLAGTVTNAKGKPMNFYASAPLFLSYNLNGIEGRVQVGRLCIMDEQPREDFSDKDADLLYSIGKMAGDALEMEFQSSKSAKAAEMQQRTSSLIRSLEDASLNAQYRHFNSSSTSSSESGEGYTRYSLVVVDKACQELCECLGAAGVAAFDVSNFRFRPQAARNGSQRSSAALSKATLPSRSHFFDAADLTEPITPPAESVSTPTYVDPDSPIISPRMSRHLSSSEAVETIDLNEGSPPPSVLSYSGPPACRPNLPEDIEHVKAVFASPLAQAASETGMNIRCQFYYRQSDSSSSSDDEEDDGASMASKEQDKDPWAELLPLDAQVKSYAVCICYNRAKARPGIMFLVMFTDSVCFDQQERFFVESTMQVALGSLLRQKLSEVDFFQAEFLRHVQHNLRTPLHGALGAVEYLRAAINNDGDDASSQIDLSADGVLATLLDSISLSGLTLNSYIDDLLSFQNLSGIKLASAPPPKRVATDIVKVIENVADEEWEFAQRLELQSHHLDADTARSQEGPIHGMELIIKASHEVRDCDWIVEVKALQDVVRKVVSNAIRFTRQGYVEISIRLGAPDALDEVGTDVTEGHAVVEIEVVDTGVGMTKDFCTNQLTRPFSKADSFRDGIGLGMTIVSSTLQKYGGKLSVASEVNLGTRVTMCVPMKRGTTHHGRNGSVSSTAPPKFAVSKIAYFGLKTRGLRRLANALCEYFAAMDGIELTHDFAEADCIVLPQRAAITVDEGDAPLLSQVKSNARFVVISSSHLIAEKGLQKLDARAVLPLPMPHGPSALRLMETFLTAEDPPLIHIAKALRSINQHTGSVTELGMSTGVRRVSGHRLQESAASTLVNGAKPVNGNDVAAAPHIELKSGKSLPPINTSVSLPRQDEFRVLVVEDNPINMKLLTTLCKRLDIRYEEAHDGAEAVAKFISFRPSVVLLDISLPIQDGFEACSQMRAHHHPSFIVAVTALSSEEDKRRGIETCGMDAWMTKPVSPRQLKGDLEEWRSRFHLGTGVVGGGQGGAEVTA